MTEPDSSSTRGDEDCVSQVCPECEREADAHVVVRVLGTQDFDIIAGMAHPVRDGGVWHLYCHSVEADST